MIKIHFRQLYYAHKQIEARPERASERVQSDQQHCADIRRVYDENRGLYGARKIWCALRREGKDIARCTVERLMKFMGLQGVVRGKKVVTTNPDASQPCPQDKVNRQFRADRPNLLWISGFTCVSTWQGMSYVAPRHGHSDQWRSYGSIIDVLARKIIGWRASTSMTTSFVLDALNQAICQRCPSKAGGLTHHSDRGSQYLSIKYTERLLDAGIDPSAGSVGDSYDNAMAETIIGLFKAEVVNIRGPWKSVGQLEWETLKWVDWFNKSRLLEPIGHITPNEAEENFYAALKQTPKCSVAFEPEHLR